MILGGDLSNYDWPFSTATAACLKAAGWQRVILGTQDIAIAEAQLTCCKAVGLEIAAVYSEPSIPNGIILARMAGVKRVYIACETPGGDATNDQVRADAETIRASGLEPGIYSGRPTWLAMGNSTEFASLPLWFPDYYDDGHYQQAVGFGGWTSCAVHQYKVTDLCGRPRDHDAFWEDDEMTPEQLAKLDAVYDFITGGATNPKGPDELAAWLASGSSVLDGYVDLRQRVATLEQTPVPAPGLKRGDTVVLQ